MPGDDNIVHERGWLMAFRRRSFKTGVGSFSAAAAARPAPLPSISGASGHITLRRPQARVEEQEPRVLLGSAAAGKSRVEMRRFVYPMRMEVSDQSTMAADRPGRRREPAGRRALEPSSRALSVTGFRQRRPAFDIRCR